MLLVVVAGLALSGLCAVPKPELVAAKPFTKVEVLALAERQIAALGPKLQGKDATTIFTLKTRLAAVKNNPAQQTTLVHESLNAFTLCLVNMKSLPALTVAAAYLVKAQPDNPRATNFYGAVLHAAKQDIDAAGVLEYTCASAKDGTLAMLNLANIYLDLRNDAKAKVLLDAIVNKAPNCREAYLALATYWYHKQNNQQARAMLLKAAQFVGVTRKAAKPKEEEIRRDVVSPADDVRVMETKVATLKTQVPFTTADIIEESFPAEARQIRERYGKLLDNECMRMPKLPQVKVNTNQDFTENTAYLETWAKVFAERQGHFLNREKYKTNFTGTESDAEVEAKGKQVATEQMREALATAKQQLAFLKGMPGIPQADIQRASAEIAKLEKEYGVSKPSQTPAATPGDGPPGWDHGSPYARMNYADYLIITRSYEHYLRKYFAEYSAKEQDILDVYAKRVEAVRMDNEARGKAVQQEHADADEHSPHNTAADPPCTKERIRAIRALNAVGNEFYKQWVNLYMPQYAQKMKPILDDYWYVAGLYVRNMNDPKVMEREYLRVKDVYLTYALQAASHIMYGSAFKYDAATEDEAKALELILQRAAAEAEQKQPLYAKAYETPEGDWMKWIEDHLTFEVSAEFLSLKITARTIEFDAWAFGPGAGIKVDLVDETMETYTGVGAKFEVGVQVGGIGAKAEGRGDFARKWTKWDFQNGTYQEGYDAKAQGSLSLGSASVSGEVTVDSQLNARGSASMNASLGQFSYANELGSFGGE